MSYGTLEKLIRLASEYETVWFIWHGGEPLMMPLKFYKNAIGLQEKYFGKDSHRVSNTIQTNGTLITKRFMNFCREKKINVGVSSEGPCNSLRSSNIRLDMMKKGGHMFSVNASVCKQSTKDQMTIYEHFVSNGIALSLSPVILSGSAEADMIPDADGYADASIEVFEKWLYDKDAEVPLMPHLQYIMSALGKPSQTDCAHSSCLTKWMSVYPNGDIYPCGKGCPQSFRLCSINEIEDLSDAFSSDAMKEILIQSIERREKCMSECSVFEYCGGGCSIDALADGSMNENGGNSCRIFKKIFMHILKTTEIILNERPDLSVYNKFVREAVIGRLVNPNIINI